MAGAKRGRDPLTISGGARPETSSPVLSYRHAGPNRLLVDLEKLVASKLLVQAASGGGKSWAIRNLCEETFGKIPQIIIDPEGEFHTLREQHDYVLAAVRGGDIEASPKTASILARRLVELSASAVIDLSEMKPMEQRQFVRRFLETMLGLPRSLWHPTLTVIDEFHIFAPESGHGEAESLEACSDFSARARKRGFCLVGATTRIAKLHKDVAGNLHNKLIGFNSLDVDIDRAAKELGFDKEHKATIRQLDPGTFYAYGPAISREVTLVRTGPVKSTHPEPGTTVAVAAVPASNKVKALIASSLADLPKEAEEEARTIDELRRSNADLSKKLRLAEKAQPAPIAKGYSGLDIEKAVTRETGKLLREANGTLERVQAEHRRVIKSLTKFAGDIFGQANALQGALTQHAENLARTPSAIGIPEPGVGVRETSRASTSDMGLKEREARHSVRVAPAAPDPSVDGEALSPARQRILNAIADLNTLGIDRPSRGNVGTWVGIAAGGGSFRNNLGALRGLIDYPADDLLGLTAAGSARAETGGGPQSLDGLHDVWYRKFPPAKREILRATIAAYPEPISREELGEQLAVEPSGGSFRNNLGALRSLGLIDYPSDGYVVATSLLFPEGLS